MYDDFRQVASPGCIFLLVAVFIISLIVGLSQANQSGAYAFTFFSGVTGVIYAIVIAVRVNNRKREQVAGRMPNQQTVSVSQPASRAYSPPCPYCAMPNPPGAKFCVTCQRPLPIGAQTPELAQEQQMPPQQSTSSGGVLFVPFPIDEQKKPGEK